MFLFLNSCIAPGGEIIPNLSVLHMVLFLFGVPRYKSSLAAAVGDVVSVSPCRTSGQTCRWSLTSARGMLGAFPAPAPGHAVPVQMDVNGLAVLV